MSIKLNAKNRGDVVKHIEKKNPGILDMFRNAAVKSIMDTVKKETGPEVAKLEAEKDRLAAEIATATKVLESLRAHKKAVKEEIDGVTDGITVPDNIVETLKAYNVTL